MYAISGDLKDVFKGDSLTALPRVIMYLSNNASFTSNVTTLPDNMDSQHFDTLNDGIYFSAMRFAMADYGYRLDEGYRIFPRPSDDSFYKSPWTSTVSTDAGGNFAAPITISIEYNKSINTNCIFAVSDDETGERYGEIEMMDVYIKNNSDAWVKVASDFSPTTKGVARLYWNPTRSLWTEEVNRTGYTSVKGIRMTIKKLRVNPDDPIAIRPRRAMIYEFDAGLEVDISNDIIDISIAKKRDLTNETFNVLGPSAANTFSITLQNTANEYNNLSAASAYKGLLNKGVRFKIDYGFKLADATYEYIPQGIFYADEWSLDNGTVQASVNGRDFSYFLQDNMMEPIIYINQTLSDVVTDVAERAGADKIAVDISNLESKDLSTGAEVDILTNQDMKSKDKSNYIWNADQTYWGFLQQVAYSDIGGYWFDEDGRFVYRAKETVYNPDDPNGEDFAPVTTLSDNNQIISAVWSTELLNNKVTMDYIIPKISKKTVGLWEADDPQVLGATALASAVDKESSIFKTGNIEDWPEEGFFKIDNEIVEYKYRTKDTFEECKRGRLGTTAASHSPTSLTDWSPNYHTWEPVGGVLKVTGVAGTWGMLKTKKQFGRNFTYKGMFKVTSAPYQIGVAVYVRSFDTYHRFVIRSKAPLGTNDGWNENSDWYVFDKFKFGSREVLKTSSKYAALTGEDHFFEVRVNNNKFTLTVDGHDVIDYTDDTLVTDGQTGSVGLLHIGPGPNYFDKITVINNEEAQTGDRIIFYDSFGKVIYEIRHYEAEYTVSPAYSVNYWLTSQEAEVIEFIPGPFSADIYVQNLADGLTTIEGSSVISEYESLSDYFILYGKAIEDDETRQLEKEDKASIRKTGKREVSVSLPWVQSKTHAKALLDFLTDVYKDGVVYIDAEIWAMPHLQLGDVVRVNYSRLGVVDDDYFVTDITSNISSGGYSQRVRLRSRSYGSMPRNNSDTPPTGASSASAIFTKFANNDYTELRGMTLSMPGGMHMSLPVDFRGMNIKLEMPFGGINAGDIYVARILMGDRDSIGKMPNVGVRPPRGWVPIRRDGNSWIFVYHVSNNEFKEIKAHVRRVMARANADEITLDPNTIKYYWRFWFRKESTGDLVRAPAMANFLGFRGVDPLQIVPVGQDSGSKLSSTTSITAPTITTTENNSIALWFGATDLTSTSITVPSGMTSKGFSRYNAASAVAIQNIAAAGATGAKTGTASSSGTTIGQMIILNPATETDNVVTSYTTPPPDSFYYSGEF